MSGLVAYPSSTLSSRAAAYLASRGPATSGVLVRDVLGLRGASPALAERVVRTLVQRDPRITALADGRWDTRARMTDGEQVLADCRFAVVDLETTGMRARRGDRIIEAAVVLIEGGVARLAFHSLVNPGIPLSPFVAGFTGIGSELLRAAPRFEEIADALLASLTGAVFVAHNARFDWSFVCAELERVRAVTLAGPRLCTVRLARRLLPPFGSRRLDNVAEYFGITIEDRHRAVGDAVAATRILERLLVIAHNQGMSTLADLLRLPVRRSADAVA